MEIEDITICFTLDKAQKNEQKAYCIIIFTNTQMSDIYISLIKILLCLWLYPDLTRKKNKGMGILNIRFRVVVTSRGDRWGNLTAGN